MAEYSVPIGSRAYSCLAFFSICNVRINGISSSETKNRVPDWMGKFRKPAPSFLSASWDLLRLHWILFMNLNTMASTEAKKGNKLPTLTWMENKR